MGGALFAFGVRKFVSLPVHEAVQRLSDDLPSELPEICPQRILVEESMSPDTANPQHVSCLVYSNLPERTAPPSLLGRYYDAKARRTIVRHLICFKALGSLHSIDAN